MNALPELTVDLAVDARDRWSFADVHLRAAADLMSVYNDDIGVDEATMANIASLAPAILPAETVRELEGIACALDATFPKVLLVNLYYDLLTAVIESLMLHPRQTK